MARRIPPRDASALDWLGGARACGPALEWVRTEGIATVGEAWDRCTRPGWLLWGLDKIGSEARFMTGLACWCVRHTTLPNGNPFTDLLTDPRSRRALEVAESWVSRRVGERAMRAANKEAWDAVSVACLVAYHVSEVAAWVSALPKTSRTIGARMVNDHLDQSVRWVAIRDGCDPDVARRVASDARLDGIRRLIIDPWQSRLGT